MKRAEPDDVFKPAASVTPGMFATRLHDALEQEVGDALSEAGRHLALHGWTGVGKTCLMEHVCEGADVSYVPADCGGTFEDIMHFALSQMGMRLETENAKTTTTSTEGSGSALGVVSGKAARETASERRYVRYAGPLETLVVDAMVHADVRVLFIDNLEDLAEGDSHGRSICRLMKLCSRRTGDLGNHAPKVVLGGPTRAIDKLLLLDEAASRRTARVEVPRMRPEEIEEILTRGEQKIEMGFDDECRAKIVVHADGFPYYAHLYALHCARLAKRDSRAIITAEDFARALATIIEACSGPLKERYSRAIRGRGQAVLRQGALAAVADSRALEVTLRDVQNDFLQLYPQYERVERVQFIGRLLKEFRDDYGILEEAWLDDGQRGYQFRDPLMRVYVRLRALRDRQVADTAWRASLPDTQLR